MPRAVAGLAVAALCAAAGGGARAADDAAGADAAARARRVPKTVTACDGFVSVAAADVPGDEIGFRLPLLQFVSQTVRDLERAWKLDMPPGGAGVAVFADDGRTNDTRVVARAVRRDRDVQTRIFLPSPGFSDLDDLRFQIAKGYFRAWIARNGAGVTNALPDWIVQGALRAADRDTARADTLFVLGLWSSARLPFFPALCTDLRLAKGPAAALPGFLAAWMREKHALRPLLDRLAAGEPWDGRALAKALTGADDPPAQDRAADEHLARLARSVLSPGAAGAWDLRVFASRLELHPPLFDPRRPAIAFREAVARAADDPVVRAAAAQKANEILLCAIGRGDALAAAARAYRAFLVAAAHGQDAGTLRLLLEAADAKMLALRARD